VVQQPSPRSRSTTAGEVDLAMLREPS